MHCSGALIMSDEDIFRGSSMYKVNMVNSAMKTIGAQKYNAKPTGFGIDRITIDTFNEEA